MSLARVVDGVPEELPANGDITYTLLVDARIPDESPEGFHIEQQEQEILASWATVLRWTEEQRNAIGIYTIQEVNAALGANQKLGEAVLAFDDDIVTATRSAVAMSTAEITERIRAQLPPLAGYRALLKRRLRRYERKGDTDNAAATFRKLINLKG